MNLQAIQKTDYGAGYYPASSRRAGQGNMPILTPPPRPCVLTAYHDEVATLLRNILSGAGDISNVEVEEKMLNSPLAWVGGKRQLRLKNAQNTKIAPEASNLPQDAFLKMWLGDCEQIFLDDFDRVLTGFYTHF
jgi:hypothetical protein